MSWRTFLNPVGFVFCKDVAVLIWRTFLKKNFINTAHIIVGLSVPPMTGNRKAETGNFCFSFSKNYHSYFFCRFGRFALFYIIQRTIFQRIIYLTLAFQVVKTKKL